MAITMPTWAITAHLSMDEYLKGKSPSAADDQQALEAVMGTIGPGGLYENNGYTTTMTDMYVAPKGYAYEWGDPGTNKYAEYVKNPNIRYDAGSNSFIENQDPLSRVGGYYITGGDINNPSQIYVTDQMAKDSVKTFLDIPGTWSQEDVKTYIANTPGFYDQYSGVNLHPEGYKDWEGITFSKDFPTGQYYGWEPKEVSGGMFGTSFMDPKQMSEWVEPVNKYVGPLVLPTVMAIGGGLMGGGLAAAGLAGGALGGTAGAATTGAAMAGMGAAGTAAVGAGAGAGASLFGSLNQGIEQGDWGGAALNMGLGAVKGAVSAGLLSSFGGVPDVPVEMGNIPIGSSLAEMEALYPQVYGSMAYDAGLGGTTAATTGSGLMYGTPEFYEAANTLGMDSQSASSLTNTSLGGQSAMNLTNTPITYGSPEMYNQGSDLGLSPQQTSSLNNTSLGGQSANQLDSNALAKPAQDALTKLASGLLGGGSGGGYTPSFSSSPITTEMPKGYGQTTNSWSVPSATSAASTATSSPAFSPFKGSFLPSDTSSQNLSGYLSDYLPLNAKAKIKDFSNFLA